MLSLTQAALEAFDNQHDFERMAADVLNACGCTDVVLQAPRGGSDGGRDILFSYDGGRKGLAWVTLRKDIEKKFHEDAGMRRMEEYSKYYLFCTVYLTSGQKNAFSRYCQATLGADFIPQDCEALRSLLDARFPDLRERYLRHVRLPVSRLFQLPGVVPDFTGRQEEIRALAGRLRGNGGKVGRSALRGMGGVGKTSLAVTVAHEVKDRFPDAQLFLDLRGMSDQPLTAAEAMARIIRDFQPDATSLPDAEAELAPMYHSVLSGKRALIVFDNARDEGQVRNLVSVALPVGFLVTSRNALALDGMESIWLDVLTSEEAVSLLRGITGGEDTEEMREVVELCGRLPLALRVAGDFLRLHANWIVPRYIEALKDETERLERLKAKTADRDVEVVLGLSARQLVAEDEALALRWEALSVFPGDFDAYAAAEVWGMHQEKDLGMIAATDALTSLMDRSLVRYYVDSNRYELHDLIRPLARNVFRHAKNQAQQPGVCERITEAERRYARHYRLRLCGASMAYQERGPAAMSGLRLYDREEHNIHYA